MNNIFIKITGATQGLISHGATFPESLGNCAIHNHDDEIALKVFKYGASSPVLKNNVRSVGLGMSKPFVITKTIDKSSPLLFQALSTGETLTEMVLKAYRTSYNGKHEHYLTIILKDSHIVNKVSNGMLETIYFTYKSMTIEHVTAHTIAKLEWKQNSPVVVDKPLLDRIFNNAVDNFIATNAGLYELGGGVVNAGIASSNALSNYLYNKSHRHIFFKEPRVSLLKIAFLSLFQSLGLRRIGFNFRSLDPIQGILVRAIFPALENAFYFEVGIVIGSVGQATVEEVYKDLYKTYLQEYGETE